MRPEVTAVITTHVRPRHAYEALQSLRASTHREVEIVIVDDGGAFTESTRDPGSDVRIIHGDSLGVARARNLGLDAARGEFIIFLDDDDVARPHRIATLLRAARQSGAALCFGMTSRVLAGGAFTFPAVPTRLASAGPVGFCDLLTCNPHVNAVLVRTDTLRSVGGFDVEASHFDDWSAWLRIADRGNAMWSVRDVVAEWRLHANGLSSQLLTIRAMKARLITMFDRLTPSLSEENARAIAMARRLVLANDIDTYDDYVNAIAEARAELHSAGRCLGRSVGSHRAAADCLSGPIAVHM